MRDKVAVLEERKRSLQDQLVAATDEKNRLLEAAANTAKRLNLAERLVNGLKEENERWAAGIESLKERRSMLVGDVMIAGASWDRNQPLCSARDPAPSHSRCPGDPGDPCGETIPVLLRSRNPVTPECRDPAIPVFLRSRNPGAPTRLSG